MSPKEIFEALKAPFPAGEIEWRIAQAGKYGGDKIWAKVLAYLTARAVMDRLDEVVGPENWRAEYHAAPHDPKGESVLCTLYLRIAGEWIGKTDGAQASDIEGTKGGISDSLKRAAVCWGIGRFLYHLGEQFAVDPTTEKPTANKDEWHYAGANQAKGMPAFYWKEPVLPAWALPSGTPPPPKAESKPKSKAPPGMTTADELPLSEKEKARAAECMAEADKVKNMSELTALWEAGPAKERQAYRDHVGPYFTQVKGNLLMNASLKGNAA